MRIPAPLPKELQLEPTGSCNLSCRVCLVRYRPKLDRAEGSMSFETHRGVVDQVPGLVSITPQGLGEPLLAPDVLPMIRFATERGTCGATSPRPELVRLTAEWGVGRLWVQNLSHSFSDTEAEGDYLQIRCFAETEALWRHPEDEVKRIFDEARERARPRCPASPSPARRTDLGRRAAGSPGCDWPWRAAYVTHRGHLQPCCMVMGEDRAVVGDADRDGFAGAWNGEEFTRFRRALLTEDPPDVCRGCSLYRRVF